MERIIEVKPAENYTLWVKFEDNYNSFVNIRPFITTGISTKLLDYDYFKKVKVDEFGGIAWENGFDFCPNFIRKLINKEID